MKIYQIEAAAMEFADRTPGLSSDKQQIAWQSQTLHPWVPVQVCGLGTFDTLETALLVLRDRIHNHARLTGIDSVDYLTAYRVVEGIGETTSTIADYEASRRDWVDSTRGITRPVQPIEADFETRNVVRQG